MTSNKIIFILLVLGLKTLIFAQKAPETLVINSANLLENQALIAAEKSPKNSVFSVYSV